MTILSILTNPTGIFQLSITSISEKTGLQEFWEEMRRQGWDPTQWIVKQQSSARKNKEFFHQNGKGTFDGTPLGPLEWLEFVQIQFFIIYTAQSVYRNDVVSQQETNRTANSPTRVDYNIPSNVWCVHDIREFQDRATTEDSPVSRSSWIVWPNKASELWAAWRCQ